MIRNLRGLGGMTCVCTAFATYVLIVVACTHVHAITTELYLFRLITIT